ncbi:metal-sensitive transcriptional regulator [Butyrivibrio sp. JL13D10]|uniref:metal-sensitive transcriptional regulator n=1 Tax=Butyrivibrio sp. JL13D10 TaxID=3236815 RepID=UPI0038B439BD
MDNHKQEDHEHHEYGHHEHHEHEYSHLEHDHKTDGTAIHSHAHYHSPEEKKKQLNRLSKAIGHLNHVKMMIENDEDCADVLMQLSAVNSALKGLGKEIINEHMSHCIVHALEDGDMTAVEEFQKAVQKFI